MSHCLANGSIAYALKYIPMHLRNLVAGLVLCAVTAGYASLIGSIPDRTLPNTPGPSFMPWIVTAAMAILSLCLVVQSAIAIMRDSAAAKLAGFASFDSSSVLLLIALAAFVAAVPVLGFLLAGVAFFAVAMILFGARNPVMIIASAIAVPLFLLLLFRHVFSIILPSGIL